MIRTEGSLSPMSSNYKLSSKNERREVPICKARDLPIYSDPVPKVGSADAAVSPIARTRLEEHVCLVRKSVFAAGYKVLAVQEFVKGYVNARVEHARGLIDYLSEEENTVPRYGAVGVGALAGHILGLRRGIPGRLLCTCAGGSMMASICYPESTLRYSRIFLEESKKYATIVYNFVYGVRKDNISDAATIPSVWESVRDAGHSFVMTGNNGRPGDGK